MARFVEIVVCGCLFSVLLSLTALAQSGQLVDPMRPRHYEDPQSAPPPSVEQPSPAPTWKLTTVLLAADRRVAVINGKSLQVGDSLDGYQLVEILSDRVQLRKNQSRVLLRRSGTGLRKDVR